MNDFNFSEFITMSAVAFAVTVYFIVGVSSLYLYVLYKDSSLIMNQL